MVGPGICSIFNTMISGSINEAFNNASGIQKLDDDTYRTRATASYVTGSHNAKIGWEGAYFCGKTTNVVNDMRLVVPLRDAGRHLSRRPRRPPPTRTRAAT